MSEVKTLPEVETPKTDTVEIIELTLDELGEVGGGVAYVLI